MVGGRGAPGQLTRAARKGPRSSVELERGPFRRLLCSVCVPGFRRTGSGPYCGGFWSGEGAAHLAAGGCVQVTEGRVGPHCRFGGQGDHHAVDLDDDGVDDEKDGQEQEHHDEHEAADGSTGRFLTGAENAETGRHAYGYDHDDQGDHHQVGKKCQSEEKAGSLAEDAERGGYGLPESQRVGW